MAGHGSARGYLTNKWNLTFAQYEYQNPADNVALAIFRDATSAQRALDASPIRFALEKTVPLTPESHENVSSDQEDLDQDNTFAQDTPPKEGIDEMLSPSQLVNRSLREAPSTKPSPKPTPMPFEAATSPAKQHQQIRWFQVTLDRSRTVHQDYVERQPFWKQFSPMKSMAQEDLAKTVPHIGLSDISKRPPNAHRTPNRVLGIMHDYVENKLPTLRRMVEGHAVERGFEQRIRNRQ